MSQQPGGTKPSRGPVHHYVYVVVCTDGSLYTGYTTDPARRLAEHNSGKGARYTKGRRPVRVLHLEEAPTREAALRREAEIKKMKRRAKQHLSGQQVPLPDHSSR